MLIGREPEQAVLGRLVAGARVGSSGCIVITGEPGIGKTALLEDAALGAQGMTVLRASGSPSERDVAFAGLLQLLGPALDHLGDIPTPRAEALEVALALREGALQERFAVGAACLSLLSRCAEDRPLFVVVDDAQDLDRPTAEAIAFAVRRLVADRIAVLVAMRPDPASPLATAGLAEIELDGLAPVDAGRLVARAARRPVSDDLVDRLHPLTGGNPLALQELAGDIDQFARSSPLSPGPVPERVAANYARRAAALSPDCRGLLLLAVVAGGDLALVEAAARRRGSDLAVLSEAERAGLVRLDGARVVVHHPLVGAGIYATAAADERRRAHLEVADALPATDLERRTWHRSEGLVGCDDDTAADLAVVAEQAARRGAHAVAATAWDRAAQLTTPSGTRSGRRLAAAEQAWLAGQQERATHLLDDAGTGGDDVTADWLRATIALRSGSLERARDLLDRAARVVAPTDPAQAVLLLSELVEACFFLADIPTALDAADRIEELLAGPAGSGPDQPVRLRGLMSVGIARVVGGGSGIGSIRAAVDALQAQATWWDDERRPGWMVHGTLFLREAETGSALVRHAVEEVRDRCALTTLPSLLLLTGRFDATTDRWQDATTAYREGIALARETGQTTDLAMLLAALATVLARCGPVEECEQTVAEAVSIATERHVHLATGWATQASGDCALAAGRTDLALSRFEELERFLRARRLLDVDLAPTPEIVECLVALGRGDEAGGAARTHLARAEAKGQPWALARAHRAMAFVAESPQEGEADYQRALAFHTDAPDAFERARTLLARGAALRRSRRRAAARQPLQAALETFDRLGARPWAERASGELEAAGATARRRSSSGVVQLTPQELQVARLLGAGSTTKQAAASMFLSPKTVEYHLRHVYQKLGITSRSELARAIDDSE